MRHNYIQVRYYILHNLFQRLLDIYSICVCALILDQKRISMSTQMKATKMLLVISTAFVILNLPSYVIRVWIFIVSVRVLILSNTTNKLILIVSCVYL